MEAGSVTATAIEGDWYLELEGQEGAGANDLPRYTLRAGQVFQGGQTESVGSYVIQNGVVKIALGEHDLLTVLVPGAAEHVVSGTLASMHGDDAVLCEAARLLRAVKDGSTH
jgi:hypothetical protein